jgi:cytochrome c556
MKRVGAQVCAWAVLVACATGPLLAHEDATGIVKDRMDQMKEMGRMVKRINERLKAERDLPGIEGDARALQDSAARIASLFPPGSRDAHSEAAPAVWERWEPFVEDARTLAREAEKLALAARSGAMPEIAAQFRAVNAACTACHDDFRARR